ncbi:peptidoglycan D,D-transpeptidase FtsI family protein [Paracoccus sp. P2]|uniref:Cell division protein FtsI (Penicillin-binding protein 3) n=1 Tax=Paracoccus pantotrophus TaxID=82367 RepID=A0A1I5EI95_PARPN|nr:penicillin-binding protein 2 [Paracoccus pantotrophus]MDF3853098.1 penicillin-binding protein 2 [Paracoccus pantotrophus]QFG36990.1 penicillin-binding protein 2 [Paracoccus pantotrophus]QLH14558.1 penicillin-binding protein 2 [Paracoccus pantotrophus]RDD98474.1 penicillin-binding protein 2 [Paracoccus pantotrophus]RKS52594.1 cell division protein FtsI (penicillin-binding protein 3) [Paracoccus pantotrophus]
MIRTPLRPLARILRARETGENPDAIEAANRAQRHAAIQESARGSARTRLFFMSCAFALAFGTVGAKMGVLAASQPSEPRVQTTGAQIISQRADITDRHGRVLATNLLTHSLYAHPQQMVEPERAARELVRIFPDLDIERLNKDFTGKRTFVWIKKKISPEQMQAVHDIGEPGLLFGPREMRLYPNGHIAAHILGGATFGKEDVASAEVVGVAGVEKAFDHWLRDPANDGAPLALSLDLTVQAAMEEVLGNGMKVMNAKGATGILMEVKTGEILAMASLPDFDPNDRPRPLLKGDPSDSPLFNRAVQGQYELGSTFKIFPVAQAIDLKLVSPATMINAKAPMKIGKYLINEFRGHNYGTLSVTDIIVKSSNVGTVRVAQLLGAERQRDFLEKLGFFEPTPIEMSEAPTGKPLVPKRWPAVTSATVAFGHGLAASPLHLAAAYATVANGGKRVMPTLIHDRRPRGGEQVLSSEAAHIAVQMLRQVVVRGSGRSANVEGYEVAGKTGTADKPRPTGGYYGNKVVSTFASVFPASDPQYVLVLSLDEPSTIGPGGESRTAGATSAPVAAEVIRRVAPLLGLRPSTETQLPMVERPLPDRLKLVSN